jgi:hypothetical protein
MDFFNASSNWELAKVIAVLLASLIVLTKVGRIYIIRILLSAIKLKKVKFLFTHLKSSANKKQIRISLKVKGATIHKVFKKLGKKSGYTIIYDPKIFEGCKRVTLFIKEAYVEDIVQAILRQQAMSKSFQYSLKGRAIVIQKRKRSRWSHWLESKLIIKALSLIKAAIQLALSIFETK